MRSGVHELRALMTVLLERRQKHLDVTALPDLIELIRKTPGWCHVDWLAAKVVGPIVARTPPDVGEAFLRAWTSDSEMWVRRTALLAPLERLRHGAPPPGLFELWSELAASCLDERLFFIRSHQVPETFEVIPRQTPCAGSDSPCS